MLRIKNPQAYSRFGVHDEGMYNLSSKHLSSQFPQNQIHSIKRKENTDKQTSN